MQKQLDDWGLSAFGGRGRGNPDSVMVILEDGWVNGSVTWDMETRPCFEGRRKGNPMVIILGKELYSRLLTALPRDI